jgi:hypothetical protein
MAKTKADMTLLPEKVITKSGPFSVAFTLTPGLKTFTWAHPLGSTMTRDRANAAMHFSLEGLVENAWLPVRIAGFVAEEGRIYRFTYHDGGPAYQVIEIWQAS